MKDLPHFKWIEITNWSDLRNPRVVKEINNIKHPIVINLTSLSPISSEMAYQLEQELSKLVHSPFYPYPIYLLGQCPSYSGKLYFFNTKKDVPPFYPEKPKSTSKIHNDLVNYNQIAQREFECINYQKANEIIQRYSAIQQKIHLAHCELTSLEHVMFKANIEDESQH